MGCSLVADSFYVSTFEGESVSRRFHRDSKEKTESEVYSNKENVGIMTALLVAHGVRHAVVCSGSRNAPIVHNLNACGSISCHAVTDERSAAFCAMGIAQADGSPVVVCVTSGTALLNLAPAIAEAQCQHLPVVVVAGDLPEAFQGQLDGQNIPQGNALGSFVGCSVTIGEPRDDEERRMVGRRVSEALNVCCGRERQPVLVNVPLSEPLFGFSSTSLPAVGPIRVYEASEAAPVPSEFLDRLAVACRPMVVFGQTQPYDEPVAALPALAERFVVLSEATSAVVRPCPYDEVLADESKWPSLEPDFVLHIGGDIVSKRVKMLIRRAQGADVWRISPTARIADTFMRLRGLLVGDEWKTLRSIDRALAGRQCAEVSPDVRRYKALWEAEMTTVMRTVEERPIAFTVEGTVRLLHQELEQRSGLAGASGAVVHYANSTPIRLANTFSKQYVYCNRGVSGIDGSVSTAAGYSLATESLVVCVTGDLSFFYDCNALWNAGLRGNLRILLLNNGCGGIFGKLPGLSASPAYGAYIAARHEATARGLCEAYSAAYREAQDLEELRRGVEWLLQSGGDRPKVLEVSLRE